MPAWKLHKYVRDHIPLEQGLRQRWIWSWWTLLRGQRPYSIRTRIKTRRPVWLRPELVRQRPYSIRTRIKTIPFIFLKLRNLSQRPYSIRTRIKTFFMSIKLWTGYVRDHIPLEQGLRHINMEVIMANIGQRPYSIRTRIKTQIDLIVVTVLFTSETIFH